MEPPDRPALRQHPDLPGGGRVQSPEELSARSGADTPTSAFRFPWISPATCTPAGAPPVLVLIDWFQPHHRRLGPQHLRRTRLSANRCSGSSPSRTPGPAGRGASQILYNPRCEARTSLSRASSAGVADRNNLRHRHVVGAREREPGTLEQLLVSPLSRWGLMLGKLTPYSCLGICMATGLYAMHWLVRRADRREPYRAGWPDARLSLLPCSPWDSALSTRAQNQMHSADEHDLHHAFGVLLGSSFHGLHAGGLWWVGARLPRPISSNWPRHHPARRKPLRVRPAFDRPFRHGGRPVWPSASCGSAKSRLTSRTFEVVAQLPLWTTRGLRPRAYVFSKRVPAG